MSVQPSDDRSDVPATGPNPSAAPPPLPPPPPPSPYGGPVPPPSSAGYAVPPPYGTYPGYQPAPQQSGNAVTALVLSLLAWAVCPLVLAVVALVFASRASSEIAASGGRIGGAGMVTAARIIAWINVALSLLGIALFVLVVVFGLFAASQVPVTPPPLPSLTLGA